MSRSHFTNGPEWEAKHIERITRLSSFQQAVATLFQAEADWEFGAECHYHAGLNTGPGRKFAKPHVFASVIAFPRDNAFEVRVHLPETHPLTAIETPLYRTSEARRHGVIVYHYRPVRLRHLSELIDLLHAAQKEIGNLE